MPEHDANNVTTIWVVMTQADMNIIEARPCPFGKHFAQQRQHRGVCKVEQDRANQEEQEQTIPSTV